MSISVTTAGFGEVIVTAKNDATGRTYFHHDPLTPTEALAAALIQLAAVAEGEVGK